MKRNENISMLAFLIFRLLVKYHVPLILLSSDFFKRITALKYKPNSKVKKVFLAIGGWNDSKDSKYSDLVMSAKKRKDFIDDVIPFLKRHDFDGLDLDWEYPQCWQGDCSLGRQGEKDRFADWCQVNIF